MFRDLEIVEQLGSGVPRILERYGRDVFEIRPNFVRVVFQYEPTSEELSEKTSEKILKAILLNRQVTIAELSEITGVSTRSVERNMKNLQDAGRLRRIGPDKGGHWEVFDG